MSNTVLIFIILVVGSLLIIRFAAKMAFKLIGIILLVPAVFIALYMFNLPPFQKNLFSIDNMNKQFCMDENKQDICNCVVKNYNSLLNEKFDKSELKEIQSKNYESAYIFTKLSNELGLKVAECSGSQDSAKVLMETFYKNLVPMGFSKNKALEWLMDNKEILEGKNERKSELDKKLNSAE